MSSADPSQHGISKDSVLSSTPSAVCPCQHLYQSHRAHSLACLHILVVSSVPRAAEQLCSSLTCEIVAPSLEQLLHLGQLHAARGDGDAVIHLPVSIAWVGCG